MVRCFRAPLGLAGWRGIHHRRAFLLCGSRLHKATLDDNSAEHIYANGHAPSRRSLGKAALAAEQTAERTRDARHLLEAEALKRELKAELDRVPGAPQRTRRSDKA